MESSVHREVNFFTGGSENHEPVKISMHWFLNISFYSTGNWALFLSGTWNSYVLVDHIILKSMRVGNWFQNATILLASGFHILADKWSLLYLSELTITLKKAHCLPAIINSSVRDHKGFVKGKNLNLKGELIFVINFSGSLDWQICSQWRVLSGHFDFSNSYISWNDWVTLTHKILIKM